MSGFLLGVVLGAGGQWLIHVAAPAAAFRPLSAGWSGCWFIAWGVLTLLERRER